MSLKAKSPRGSGTDVLRDEYESSREWKLRKMFLDANVDSLSEDRLVCLSKCFINSAMYGCSYPRPVMREIDSRSGGLLESYRQEAREDRLLAAKKQYAVAFVKASDNHSTITEHHTDQDESNNHNVQSNGARAQQPALVEIVDMANYQGERNESGASSKASDLPFTATDQLPRTASNNFSETANEELPLPGTSSCLSTIITSVHAASPLLPMQEYKKMSLSERHPLLKKLRLLAHNTIKSKEEYALNKVMNSMTKGAGVKVEFRQDEQTAKRLGESFAMAVLFNDCLIATGVAKSKALARKIAMELALQKLYLPYLRIAETESGDCQEIQASFKPFIIINNKRRHKQTNEPQPSVSAQSVELMFPGKGLISSKDFLPHSIFQISNKASMATKESTGTESPQQNDKKIRSVKDPVRKTFSKISNVKTGEVEGSDASVKKFILVQLSGIEESPLSILHRSADFSGMVLDIEHTVHSPVSVSCEVRLEGQVIGEASESNVKTAKSEAGSRALDFLGQQCWVLKLKGVDGTSAISKGELFKQIQQRTDVIGETNLGNKMLRKMGWTGGGVGKGGEGIVEPVSAEGVLGRAGLGLSSSSAPGAEFEERQFRQKVRTALKKYIESEEQEDLRFAIDFSKEERKIIHQEAFKFHLRTVSRGKQDNRYLTVGRKRSSQQLLQHVSECGGETNSYILLPPGSYQYQQQSLQTASNS